MTPIIQRAQDIFLKYQSCFAKQAFDSKLSRGRHDEKNQADIFWDQLLDPFEYDLIKIMRSQALARLKARPQVLLGALNAKSRNRMTHVNECLANARLFAFVAKLNIYLISCIALGHDVGHGPGGHRFESFVSRYLQENFYHSIFSVIILQLIEKMNLNYETARGILLHTSKIATLAGTQQDTVESQAFAIIDSITYCASDLEDAINNGFFQFADLPKEVQALGETTNERNMIMMAGLLEESAEEKKVSFEHSEIAGAYKALRKFLFQNYYLAFDSKSLEATMEVIYDHLVGSTYFAGCDPLVLLALMTDHEVNQIAIMLNNKKIDDYDFCEFGIYSMASSLRGQKFELMDPGTSQWRK